MKTNDPANRETTVEPHAVAINNPPIVDPSAAIPGRYENNVFEPGTSKFQTLILTERGTYQYTYSVKVTGIPVWDTEPGKPNVQPWNVGPPSSGENSGVWSRVPDTDPLQITLQEHTDSGGTEAFMTLICNGNTLINPDSPVGEVWKRTGPPVPVIPPIIMD